MTLSPKFLALAVLAVACLLSTPVCADTVWVSSVSCDSTQVSVGQTVYVKVAVRAGTAPVCILSSDSIRISLTDTFGNRYDTLVTHIGVVSTLPDTIGILGNDTLTYGITILAGLLPLQTGALALQLDATCTARFIDTVAVATGNRRDSDAAANLVDTWIPQTQAIISLIRLSLGRDTYAGAVAKDTCSLRMTNPDTVVLRICLQNTGMGTAKVSIDTNLVVITNGAGVKVTSSCSIIVASDSPHAVTGGSYDTINLIIVFPDTTYQKMLGSLSIGLKGAGSAVTDSNSGTVLTVTRTADTPTITSYYPLSTVIGEVVSSCDSRCWISIPAAKLNVGTEVTIVVSPVTAGTTAANLALASDATIEEVPYTTYQVELTRAADTPTLVNMILNIMYSDTGMTAGEERSIRIFRLTGNSWGSALTDSNSPSTTINVAKVYLGSLSIFRCIITNSVANDLSRVRAFPNPFVPYDGDDNTGVPYNGAANSGITFIGLTGTANLKIYTLDGVLVDAEQLSDQGNAQWDVKNSQGQECASGIYFYLVTDGGGGVAKGTLCIIR